MTIILPMDIGRQKGWSERTFGPGTREAGILDHMRKEMIEVEHSPNQEEKIAEWIDLMILAIDGAWRAGATPEQIIEGYHDKCRKNRNRNWPDWRTAEPGKAIEHDRSEERKHSPSCTEENRLEGWYPSDCKPCDAFSKRMAQIAQELGE